MLIHVVKAHETISSIAHDNKNRIDHRGCTVFYKIGRRKDRH